MSNLEASVEREIDEAQLVQIILSATFSIQLSLAWRKFALVYMLLSFFFFLARSCDRPRTLIQRRYGL